MPEIYAVKLDKKGNEVLDPKTGQAIMTGKPNKLAYDEAKKMIGYGTVTSSDIRTEGSKKEELATHMRDYESKNTFYTRIIELESDPVYQDKLPSERRQKALDEERARKRAELGLAAGGRIPALAEDPPMLDLSSRF